MRPLIVEDGKAERVDYEPMLAAFEVSTAEVSASVGAGVRSTVITTPPSLVPETV